MKELSEQDIRNIANSFNYEYAAVRAIIEVESAGRGFDSTTGKILIQFEPHIFKKYTKAVIQNGVEGQAREWKAFNEAWKIDPTSTMLSTSYGLGQIMGFNYKLCGYNSVNEMLDDFKTGETAQLKGMMNFIRSNRKLNKAIKEKDWRTFAYYYNGPGYKINNYDVKLDKAFKKYSV